MRYRLKPLSAVIAAGLLTACSGGGGGLSTGSLFGSKQAATVAAAAPVETPGMRAAQVGAVSARATKCGYNFDAARLKSGFLGSEAQKGASPEDLGRIEKEFDTIRVKVSATIATEPDFCTEPRTRAIKADLMRHLAGDYAPPVDQRKIIDERLLAAAPRTREVINPDFMTDRSASKTKRVEE